MAEAEFLQIMVNLSEAVAEKDVEMLRVLYRGLVPANALQDTKSAFDIFQLLRGPGFLKATDISILFETIQLTGLNNLKKILERYVPFPADVKIDRFPKYRQDVVNLGTRLSVEDIRKICEIHGCNFSSPWKLIQHLENTSVLTEESLPSFLDTLKPHKRNEDFNKLLSELSDEIENSSEQHVDMLRIMYTDLGIVQADLWTAKTAYDVFKLLEKAGCLASTNISILCETVKLTGMNNLKKVIDRFEPYPDEVEITRFSQHRQDVVDLGKKYSGRYLQRICRLYEAPRHCRYNGWKLLKFLEDNDHVSVGNIETFPKKLETDEFEIEGTPSKKRRNQDVIIRDYLEWLQRKLYKDVKITPAIWNTSSIPMDIAGIFTDLTLRHLEDGRSDNNDGIPIPLKKMLSIIRSTESCKVLITGEGGMGKTTLIGYIASNWANGIDCTFQGKLLFLINIRDIRKGKTILDVIVQKIDTETFSLKTALSGDPVKLLKSYITEHDNEVLILLDGLDELEKGVGSPVRLFRNLELEKCSVILTSRPGGNIAEFDKQCDAHIEVKGFSPQSIYAFIKKYFDSRMKPELGNRLSAKFNLHTECTYSWGGAHKEAFELCSSPFLLLKFCTIWEHTEHLPTDLSDLFKELICCILNQHINRPVGNDIAIGEFDRIPEKYKSAILALGKCMYERLKENKLSIDKFELTKVVENKELVDLALDPGFVYKDKPDAQDDFKEIYTPPHKLISEAIAGFYLSVEIGKLDSDEYDIIRSNEYLHMTRVFAIEFLGASAGKLLKPWLINRASNYYSIAQYFSYVKKEHEETVLRELDEDLSPETKAECYQMCETFRTVLSNGDGGESTGEHVFQLMSKCYVKYGRQPKKLVKNMVSFFTHTECPNVCTRLVHMLILIDGLYGGYASIDTSYYEYLANWEDDAICMLTGKMEQLQFTYSSNRFSKLKTSQQTKLSPKFIMHLMKRTPDLAFVTLNCITGAILNTVFSDLNQSKDMFKLEYISLRNNDLSDKDVSLLNLSQIAPKLKEIDMSQCRLSGSIIGAVVNECKSHNIALQSLSTFIVSDNNFRDTDGSVFANFIKFAPELKYLGLSRCHLSTLFLSNLWRECDRIGVVLRDHMFRLKGNNFSDIDGASLAKLVRISGHSFRWTDYSLLTSNLQCLISHACDVYGGVLTLPWEKLDVSGIDLTSVDAKALACLFDISPNLYTLNMDNCKLSGSSINNILHECETIGVVLKDSMLSLKGNHLSDIDDKALSVLVHLINTYDNSRKGRRQRIYSSAAECGRFFKWSDYSFSANNLHGLIKCLADTLTWTKLDLSGVTLDSLSGETLARLLKMSPQLDCLKMNDCKLSGSLLKSAFDECDKSGIKLKGKIRLSLKGNDLSDIDDESLATVVTLSKKSFKWSDYSLSADNLRDLILLIGLCRGEDGTLSWDNLDLSNINLVSMKESTLVGLFNISPKLEVLNMSKCHMKSNMFDNVVKKCKGNKVVLGFTDLLLNGNDFESLKSETIAALPICIPNLKQLDLSYCNLPCSIMESLTGSSTDRMKSLTAINLSGNDFSALNETTVTTFTSFVPKLDQLELRNCNLLCNTVQHLTKIGSKTSVVLKRINIGGNDLSGLNWRAFSSHISYESHRHIRIIKLDDCHLPNTFLGEIARIFTRKNIVLGLIEVFLHDNDLSNLSSDTLIQLLRVDPSLMRLYIDNCNLTSKDVLALVEAFTYAGSHELLRVFNTLRLSKNNLSDIDGALLASLFSAVYSLCSPSLRFIPQLVVLSSCQLSDGILMKMIDSWQVPARSFELVLKDNNIVDKPMIKRKLSKIIADLDELY